MFLDVDLTAIALMIKLVSTECVKIHALLVVFVASIHNVMQPITKLFVHVFQLTLEILLLNAPESNMNVKLIATVEETLFVLIMNAKISMNVYKAEVHVHLVLYVQICLVDTNAVVRLAWMVILMAKDVDKCIKCVEEMKIVSLLKRVID